MELLPCGCVVHREARDARACTQGHREAFVVDPQCPVHGPNRIRRDTRKPVGTVKDQSGNGNHLVAPANPANAPTMPASASLHPVTAQVPRKPPKAAGEAPAATSAAMVTDRGAVDSARKVPTDPLRTQKREEARTSGRKLKSGRHRLNVETGRVEKIEGSEG